MINKVHINNLPFQTTEEDLRKICEKVGEVVEVTIPTERDTSRPRGYAIVEFSDAATTKKAVEKLHEQEFNGRQLCVSIAEDENRGRGGRW